MNYNDKTILIFASDLSCNSGEGILGIEFLNAINNLLNGKKVIIKTYENTFSFNKFDIKKINFEHKVKKNFFHKYFGPLYGSLYLLFYFKKYKLIYLNYLPLWNFIIFLILPKKTILGPITGGAYLGPANSLNLIIRKYVFPILYFFSKKIIEHKFKKIIFSTNLLQKFFPNNKSYLFNFSLLLFKKKKVFKKKKYDVIFYNRYHITKHTEKTKKLLSKISNLCKVCVVGDFFDHPKVLNFGWVSRIKVFDLISKSKIGFNSSENPLSIFGIDCANFGLTVVSEKGSSFPIKLKKNLYRSFTFSNTEIATKKVLNLLKKRVNINYFKLWNNITSEKKKIKKFINDYYL